MRLIDADKLKRTTGIFQYQIKDAFDRLASGYKSEDVENAPTVEAIPVEWINKQIDDNAGKDIVYASDLLTMLKRWKEHATD